MEGNDDGPGEFFCFFLRIYLILNVIYKCDESSRPVCLELLQVHFFLSLIFILITNEYLRAHHPTSTCRTNDATPRHPHGHHQ